MSLGGHWLSEPTLNEGSGAGRGPRLWVTSARRSGQPHLHVSPRWWGRQVGSAAPAGSPCLRGGPGTLLREPATAPGGSDGLSWPAVPRLAISLGSLGKGRSCVLLWTTVTGRHTLWGRVAAPHILAVWPPASPLASLSLVLPTVVLVFFFWFSHSPQPKHKPFTWKACLFKIPVQGDCTEHPWQPEGQGHIPKMTRGLILERWVTKSPRPESTGKTPSRTRRGRRAAPEPLRGVVGVAASAQRPRRPSARHSRDPRLVCPLCVALRKRRQRRVLGSWTPRKLRERPAAWATSAPDGVGPRRSLRVAAEGDHSRGVPANTELCFSGKT